MPQSPATTKEIQMTQSINYICERCGKKWLATKNEWGLYDPPLYDGKYCQDCDNAILKAYIAARNKIAADEQAREEQAWEEKKEQEKEKRLDKWLAHWGEMPQMGRYYLRRNLRNSVGRYYISGRRITWDGRHPWTGIFPSKDGGRCSGEEHQVWISKERATALIMNNVDITPMDDRGNIRR